MAHSSDNISNPVQEARWSSCVFAAIQCEQLTDYVAHRQI